MGKRKIVLFLNSVPSWIDKQNMTSALAKLNPFKEPHNALTIEGRTFKIIETGKVCDTCFSRASILSSNSLLSAAFLSLNSLKALKPVLSRASSCSFSSFQAFVLDSNSLLRGRTTINIQQQKQFPRLTREQRLYEPLGGKFSLQKSLLL